MQQDFNQGRWSVKIWCGILDGKIIDPFVLNEHLNGECQEDVVFFRSRQDLLTSLCQIFIYGIELKIWLFRQVLQVEKILFSEYKTQLTIFPGLKQKLQSFLPDRINICIEKDKKHLEQYLSTYCKLGVLCSTFRNTYMNSTKIH